MNNYADRGGCFLPILKAEVDNIFLDLHYPSITKAEFNFFLNTFKFLEGLCPLTSNFF